MDTFFWGIAIFLLVNAFACLYRAYRGPTVVDRVLAINIVVTKTLVVLVRPGDGVRSRALHRRRPRLRLAQLRPHHNGQPLPRNRPAAKVIGHDWPRGTVAALTVVLAGVGALFFLVGTVGLLRLPDFYSRTHAATKCDTLGAGSLLLALAIFNGRHARRSRSLVLAVLVSGLESQRPDTRWPAPPTGLGSCPGTPREERDTQ